MRAFARTLSKTALILAFALGAAATLRATVIVPADLGELTRDAEAIARGRVVAIDAQWTEEHRRIETIVTLEVEGYLKGRLGSTLRFRVPGGTLGRFTHVVIGAPHFAAGQRVIVFLGTRGPTVPFILGLSQGVFRLPQQSQGAPMVVPSPVLPGVSGAIVRGAASRGPVPLADFEAEVRTLVEAVH